MDSFHSILRAPLRAAVRGRRVVVMLLTAVLLTACGEESPPRTLIPPGDARANQTEPTAAQTSGADTAAGKDDPSAAGAADLVAFHDEDDDEDDNRSRDSDDDDGSRGQDDDEDDDEDDSGDDDTGGETTPPDTGGGTPGGGTTPPDAGSVSHVGRFTTYEGSKTCKQCHLEQTQAAHAALHYQWTGPTPYVVNMQTGGKLGGINDFCGYPDINWLSILTNLDNVKVDGGCATCHIGMGAKPNADFNATGQADNVDCLVCHSDSYRRKVEQQADGTFHFVPAPEKMTVPLLQAITDIQAVPTSGSCVNCHSYAGGGCNNKRGDMEEAHRNPPTRSFDVHLASRAIGGAGLRCASCHTTSNHRIAGRGTDLRATDLDVPVRCTNCHNAAPHGSASLNNHTDRVDCTVCHIPFFAKIASTDMLRDFSKPPQIDATKRLYEPYIERQANVVPEYRFFNGTSFIYQFGTPAVAGPNGRVSMAHPLGDRSDPNAKLFAFKHHLAVQPIDPATQRLLPIKTGILFQTANVDLAIKQGTAEVGWQLPPQGYAFIGTERYMGIFHEVAPANEALQCNACHNGGTRVDFAALGYTPRDTVNGRPLCASCHGDESNAWGPDEFFTAVHQEHVQGEGIACSRCHTF